MQSNLSSYELQACAKHLRVDRSHPVRKGRLPWQSIRKGGIALILVFLLSGFGIILFLNSNTQPTEKFDGERAWQDVYYQTELGPRIPGSQAHAETVKWIQEQLIEASWLAEIQEAEMMGHSIYNVIARRPENDVPEDPWLILGAHYDSRIYADRDPDPQKRKMPVPGANDGASGVAVLLELARVLPEDLQKNVWLVFFDAEDNGNIPGWDWILGSRAFVEHLEEMPDAAIIVDMIGDADLNIYMERNSDTELLTAIWTQAEELGYADQFIPVYKYSILDDHTPFIEAGVPAADLIDFDYPYWHTTEDTADKVSLDSLQAVGDTLLAWLTRSEGSQAERDRSGIPGSWIERLMLLFRRERLR
jgi:glutaminyl-peptide cyclotransferase